MFFKTHYYSSGYSVVGTFCNHPTPFVLLICNSIDRSSRSPAWRDRDYSEHGAERQNYYPLLEGRGVIVIYDPKSLRYVPRTGYEIGRIGNFLGTNSTSWLMAASALKKLYVTKL